MEILAQRALLFMLIVRHVTTLRLAQGAKMILHTPMAVFAILVQMLLLIALDVQMTQLVQNAILASTLARVNALHVQLVAVNAQTHQLVHPLKLATQVHASVEYVRVMRTMNSLVAAAEVYRLTV